MEKKNDQKKDENKAANKKKDQSALLAPAELNEEDQALKDKLELCVERLSD